MYQPACKPGSVGQERGCPHVTAIPLRPRLPDAFSDLPGRSDPDIDPGLSRSRATSRVVPIRSCSRWGLPCRLRRRSRGALLPHLFTLAAVFALPLRQAAEEMVKKAAVYFLWHFP